MAAVECQARFGLHAVLFALLPIFSAVLSCLAGDTTHSNEYSTMPLQCDTLKNVAQQQGWTEFSVPKTGEQKFKLWLRNATVDTLARGVFYSGTWEQGEVDQLEWAFSQYNATSTPGVQPVFLDIGANVGWFTLSMASRKRKVYAFEAMLMNAQMVAASLCLNPDFAAGVALYNVGLGPAPDRCWAFSVTKNVGNGVTMCGIPSEEAAREAARTRLEETSQLRGSINIARLDDVLLPKLADQLGTTAIVAKMDIEGFEYEALQGAAALLARGYVHYMVMEFSYMVTLRSGKHAPLHFLQYLSGLGFAVSIHSFSGPFVPPLRLHSLPHSTGGSLISLYLVHRKAPTFGSIQYLR